MTEFQTELDNAWQMSDELWQQIHPLLLENSPPKRTGRKRADWRRMIDGIVYRVRTGCKWNKLPKQFGDDSTVHRWYQRWCKSGIMTRVWSMLVAHSAELAELTPEWQVVAAAPEVVEHPAAVPMIAGVVGETPIPTAIPITAPAATALPEVAAVAYSPTPAVAIAPETVTESAPVEQTPSETVAPAAAAAEQPYLPQIAAETRHDHQEPAERPAAATEQQSQPFTTEDPHRRAA